MNLTFKKKTLKNLKIIFFNAKLLLLIFLTSGFKTLINYNLISMIRNKIRIY